MLKKSEIDQFYDDVKSLGLKFPVAAIAKETGFSKGQVSDYLKRNKEPSANFLSMFYQKFAKGSTNVPRGTNSSESGVEKGDVSGQLLADLVHTNRNLSESNKSLAFSHEELVGMVKKDSTSDEAQYTMEETVAMVLGLREYLAEIAAYVKKMPPHEAMQELHSKVKAARAKGGKKGSQTAVGK